MEHLIPHKNKSHFITERSHTRQHTCSCGYWKRASPKNHTQSHICCGKCQQWARIHQLRWSYAKRICIIHHLSYAPFSLHRIISRVAHLTQKKIPLRRHTRQHKKNPLQRHTRQHRLRTPVNTCMQAHDHSLDIRSKKNESRIPHLIAQNWQIILITVSARISTLKWHDRMHARLQVRTCHIVCARSSDSSMFLPPDWHTIIDTGKLRTCSSRKNKVRTHARTNACKPAHTCLRNYLRSVVQRISDLLTRNEVHSLPMSSLTDTKYTHAHTCNHTCHIFCSDLSQQYHINHTCHIFCVESSHAYHIFSPEKLHTTTSDALAPAAVWNKKTQ